MNGSEVGVSDEPIDTYFDEVQNFVHGQVDAQDNGVRGESGKRMSQIFNSHIDVDYSKAVGAAESENFRLLCSVWLGSDSGVEALREAIPALQHVALSKGPKDTSVVRQPWVALSEGRAVGTAARLFDMSEGERCATQQSEALKQPRFSAEMLGAKAAINRLTVLGALDTLAGLSPTQWRSEATKLMSYKRIEPVLADEFCELRDVAPRMVVIAAFGFPADPIEPLRRFISGDIQLARRTWGQEKDAYREGRSDHARREAKGPDALHRNA